MDDGLRAAAFSRLHHHPGSLDVGFHDLAWIWRPQPVIGGDMKDVPRALRRSKDRPRVARVASQDLGVGAVEIASRAARPHQRAQSKACPGQFPPYCRAENTRSTRDRDAVL